MDNNNSNPQQNPSFRRNSDLFHQFDQASKKQSNNNQNGIIRNKSIDIGVISNSHTNSYTNLKSAKKEVGVEKNLINKEILLDLVRRQQSKIDELTNKFDNLVDRLQHLER